MDENVVSIICRHLSEKDLICFALVNKTIYQYCKHTNITGNKCTKIHRIPYSFISTIMEHARLRHAMRMLEIVKELHDNNVPMRHCSCIVVMQKPCGVTIKVQLGRHVVINDIAYCYSQMEFISDMVCSSKKDIINHVHTVLSIDQNIDRLQHKINSIMSHAYDTVNYNFIVNSTRDMCRTYAEILQTHIIKHLINVLHVNDRR